jgi:hypothetical protein
MPPCKEAPLVKEATGNLSISYTGKRLKKPEKKQHLPQKQFFCRKADASDYFIL